MTETYPSDYPDSCPPSDIDKTDGIFIRLIPRPSGAKRKDFTSVYKKNKLHSPDIHNECEQRAISLYRGVKDAIDFLKNHPKAHERYFAWLDIPQESGTIIQKSEYGRDSHHHWWIPIEVNPVTLVTKIEDPQSGGYYV